MTEHTTKVSVVIRCYNEEKHISRLLGRLESQQGNGAEIIVVDSGSTDRTLDIAGRFKTQILHIEPGDFSFGRALNLGCRHARGEFLVFLSAHVYPTSDLLLQKLLAMFDNPRVALVYGKQRGDEQSAYFETRMFNKLYPNISIFSKKDPFCNNACSAIRRQLWEQFPFDEEITGLEDIAWAKRIIEEGYEIAYCAEAEIVHFHDETPIQRFNRYRREAIAFKKIFPDSHFGVLDMLWLYSSNCVSDLIAAYHDRLIGNKFLEILRTRWHQFSGTLSGYRVRSELADQMKMQLFYPDFPQSAPKKSLPSLVGSDPEPVSKKPHPRIVALAPMRADSKRVPNKNIRLFNGRPLYWHILSTLTACPYIDEIYVNTDSPLLMDKLPKEFDRVKIIPRPQSLCGDTVPMTDILIHDVEIVQADWYLQTHSTNPLIRSQTLAEAIETLLKRPNHDSLFGVTPMRTRLWTKDARPLNHDPAALLRTQDLEPVYEENSNIYIFKSETLKRLNSRIGERPIMFEIPPEEAWDIDEELDFRVAEFILGQTSLDPTWLKSKSEV